jgi:hypothetical protein
MSLWVKALAKARRPISRSALALHSSLRQSGCVLRTRFLSQGCALGWLCRAFGPVAATGRVSPGGARSR